MDLALGAMEFRVLGPASLPLPQAGPPLLFSAVAAGAGHLRLLEMRVFINSFNLYLFSCIVAVQGLVGYSIGSVA